MRNQTRNDLIFIIILGALIVAFLVLNAMFGDALPSDQVKCTERSTIELQCK